MNFGYIVRVNIDFHLDCFKEGQGNKQRYYKI